MRETQQVTWMLISAGRGPAECELFVRHLATLIAEEAANHGICCNLVEVTPGVEDDTLASALLSVEGAEASEFAARWAGTHKWVCPSPFRPNHRRKNWFVGVSLLELPTRTTWSPSELRVETFRSSGPGGQHANKVNSAVRVTHLPSGVSAVAQEERSQHRNKSLAMARLEQALEVREQGEQGKAMSKLREEHDAVERGGEVTVFKGPKFERIR